MGSAGTLFGVTMFPTDEAMAIPQLATAAEARGFDALFLPEHTHIPASRLSPWPGGDELPREYYRTQDPFVALAAAAAVTTRLKLGTGIALVTERDPILMAKQVASLDLISDGRLLLGIGAGWNAEEMANHGVAFEQRWAVLRERVLAMRAIWSDDPASFHGEHVSFEPMHAWPKPVQPGGPPLLLGASSRFAFARIAEYADGWMPIARPGVDLEDGMARLEAAMTAVGRDMASLDLTLFGVGPDPERVKRYIGLGFRRLVFGLPPAPADKVVPLLDRYADLAAAVA